MIEEKNFKKNFIWNVIGTGLNSFSSLFFLIIVTRINGMDEAGIFTIAFSTACILYIIGTYAGRVYQVTESNISISDKDYILNRILSVSFMMISIIFFIAFKRYDLYKATIFILLTIFKGIEAFSDVFYGIMQKKDLLYKVGQSYFLKAFSGIMIFIIVDFISKNLILSCLGMIVAWILFVFLFDLPIIYSLISKNEKINFKNSFSIFKSGFFIFAITFLGIYILNAPKYAIDNFLELSYQTIFGVIVMPATAIGLFGQFLLHPYLNEFSKNVGEKNFKKLNDVVRKIVLYIFGFGIIASVVAYIIGIPVLQVIYGIDLSGYKIMLTTIIIASTLYNVGVIYSNVLTTMRKTKSQFIVYIAVSLFAGFLSNILTIKFKIQGAVNAYFAIMLLLFLLYFGLEKILILKEEKKK